MDDHLMRIGEIAGFFNVSVKTIRVYEKAGIIKPVKTDPETRYRYYSPEQVQQLNAVLELKQLGFSLAEIKTLLHGGTTAGEFSTALTRKQAMWQNVISSAEHKISAIDNIAASMANTSQADKLHELTDEERAWLLVKMVCVGDLQGQSILSEALWV